MSVIMEALHLDPRIRGRGLGSAATTLAAQLQALEPGSLCFSCDSNLVASPVVVLSSGRRCLLVCPCCGAEVDLTDAGELPVATVPALVAAA